MQIIKLNVRGIGGSAEDVKDRYDPESIPMRVSIRAEEIARKVNELIDTVNQMESEISRLQSLTSPSR